MVPVASNQREMDSRIYSPAQCVGQLAENAAAKGSLFNATLFEVSILQQFDTCTRAKGTDVGVPSLAQALKVLDDGVGFLYEEVEDMLTYGTPDKIVTPKKFGEQCCAAQHLHVRAYVHVHSSSRCITCTHTSSVFFSAGQNNHGLKAVAATLSPACALLFSKSVKADGARLLPKDAAAEHVLTLDCLRPMGSLTPWHIPSHRIQQAVSDRTADCACTYLAES